MPEEARPLSEVEEQEAVLHVVEPVVEEHESCSPESTEPASEAPPPDLPAPAPAPEASTPQPPGAPEGPAEVGPPPVEERAPAPELDTRPLARAAGYHADDWAGDDLLGIDQDVEALSSLIAARSVEPPLCIGLFGHGGSGKTFFMRKLRRRIDELARAALEADGSRWETGACRRVVQLELNAWHLAEGNLWASLLEHILANLRLAGEVSDEDVAKRRDHYARALRQKADTRAQLEARIAQLRQTEEKARSQAEQARKLDEGASKARAAEAKKNILDAIEVQLDPRQRTLLGLLDLPDEELHDATRLRDAFQKTRSTWGRVVTFARRVRKDPGGPWRVAAGLASGGALLALLLWTDRWFAPGATRVWVAAIFPTLILAAIPLLPYARRVWEAFGVLEEKGREIELQTKLKRAVREKRLGELFKESEQWRQERNTAEQVARKAAEEIAILRRELENDRMSSPLSELIEDRVGASDCRRHLGMRAVFRRDFERLSAILRQQDEAAGSHAIDRIILYVDDLDRCPPERVVQVLEAIHILLASPPFVVLVGADLRWLARSLERCHEGRGYLEKLIQVPFQLQPMDARARDRLLEELTRSTPHAPPEGEPPPSPPSRRPELLALAPLELEPREQALMKQLSPLVGRSPRTLKRFVNCYRLVKARQWDERAEPAPGPLEAVMLMLAIVAGMPDRLPGLIQRLSALSRTDPLPKLAEALGDGPEWAELKRSLELLSESSVTLEVGSLLEAQRLASRFTFQPADPLGL